MPAGYHGFAFRVCAFCASILFAQMADVIAETPKRQRPEWLTARSARYCADGGRNGLGVPCQVMVRESRARVAATNRSERACFISRS